MKDTGCSLDEATGYDDDYPIELTEEQMENVKFRHACEDDTIELISFKQQLGNLFKEYIMEFKWYVTVDFQVSSNGHDYEDDEEKMNKAIIAFQNAQEAFFEYLDGSDFYEYEVVAEESK